MQKAYSRIKWENEPSQETPLNDANLNRMDSAIDEVDNRILTLDITKAEKTEISEFFTEITFNESTGVLTFTRKNGSTIRIDTKLEKLAVNFSYDANNERLVITLDDGSVQYVDMKALVTQYEFTESDTILLSVDSSGKVSASIKLGSITGDMLEPNYLANVTVQAESAAASANAAAMSEANAARSEANAAVSETNAASDASAASESAEAAAESEENAAASESNASDSAESAASNAESAAASASSAGASASTATSAASSASASASAAAESAATATEKASAAEASAEVAAEEADRAEDAASRAEAIVGFTIDTALSTESTNPIANKAVAEEFGKYFPKSGGAISGNLFASSTEGNSRIVGVYNSLRRIYNQVDTAGEYKIYDITNDKVIINSTANGTNTFNGTLTKKPTGSYTGNSDATERIIQTNGIGSVLYLKGQGWGVLVHEKGAIVTNADGRAISTLPLEKVNFTNGVLTIKASESAINGSGVVYIWTVL